MGYMNCDRCEGSFNEDVLGWIDKELICSGCAKPNETRIMEDKN